MMTNDTVLSVAPTARPGGGVMSNCHLCGYPIVSDTDHFCIKTLADRIAKLEAAAHWDTCCTDSTHDGPPPAPEFKLGPKTALVLAECLSTNAIDINNAKRVARETARLIAEWLRYSSWDVITVANAIERADWGRE